MKNNANNKKVLLIDILDEEIKDILGNLKKIFSKEESSSNSIHITVRGPYYDITKKFIQEFENKSGSHININGVGLFENDNQYVVYYKVEFPDEIDIKSIWKKPDYPKKNGVHPHISIYKGSDKNFADKVYNFLKIQGKSFTAKDYKLSMRTLHQSDKPDSFDNNINNEELSYPILKDAIKLVEQYEYV
jgi:2'-5' RNA ligase